MNKSDIDKMTPRELSAGLMRGNRIDMQTGYSPRSAALTAAERNNLSEQRARELLDWSLGFHDGLYDAMHRDDPGVEDVPKRPSLASNEMYLQGRINGRSESGLYLYPCAPEQSGVIPESH